MGEWRHREPDWVEPYYAKCGHTMGALVCGCTTLTPDPASQCGKPGCPAPEMRHAGVHDHVPTRCVCGHAIEEVRKP